MSYNSPIDREQRGDTLTYNSNARLLVCLAQLLYCANAAAAPGATPTPAELLLEAERYYNDLEYDMVVPMMEQLLGHGDSSLDQKLDAYMLHGSALAIIGDPLEAESSFRLLLRARPEYRLPDSSPPKIQAAFDKVLNEERAIAERMREIQRARAVESLGIEGTHPGKAVGGQPVGFSYRLKDPRAVVEGMQVLYRRDGQDSFSSLALQRDSEGLWRGLLPGALTANDEGTSFDYYLATMDADGMELMNVGSVETPKRLMVAAGQVPVVVPFYETRLFWSLVAAGVTSVGTASWVLYQKASALPESDLGTVEMK